MQHKYLLEPILNSELVLINNSKLLKDDSNLLHESYLPRIDELRKEFINLEERSEQGEIGLQKKKRVVRDELRTLSSKTYTNRDRELFGKMITTMAQKIVTRPQFSSYTMKDEMQSLAIQHILSYSWGFKPFSTSDITGQYVSAFAYISTIIFNACIATINKFNKEQLKAKEDFLETQKLIHKESNSSTYGEDFTTPQRTIRLVELQEGELLTQIKSITINEETQFIIPKDYKITAKEYDFILKYEYNISILRNID